MKTERREAASAAGRPAPAAGRRSSADLPGDRDALLALHAQERRRRASAELGSPEFKAAVERLADIEIQIARIERAMDPPRV